MTEIKGYNDSYLKEKKLLKRLTSKRQFVFSPAGENSKWYLILHTCCWDIKVFLTQLTLNLWSALSHSLIKTEHLQVRCRQEVTLARPFWLSCSCWHTPLLSVFPTVATVRGLGDKTLGEVDSRSDQFRQQSLQKICIMTYIHLTVLWFSGPISELCSWIHVLSKHTSYTFIKMQHYPQITKHIPKLESISPN